MVINEAVTSRKSRSFYPGTAKKKILLVELCLKMSLMSDFPTFF